MSPALLMIIASLLFATMDLHGQHRSEDLVADQRVVRRCTGDHGRFEIGAAGLGQDLLSADPQLGPFGKPRWRCPSTRCRRRSSTSGPILVSGSRRVGREPLRRGVHDALHHLLGDFGVHHQPGACGTHLTGVEEDRPGGRIGGRVQVGGVGKDDVRRLAAEFEIDPLEVAVCRVAQEVATDLGGSGEGQHVDIRVLSEMAADHGAVSAEHIEHTRRQTCHALPIRRPAAWTVVTARRSSAPPCSRRPAPARTSIRQRQREVPRHDRGDHTGRLPGDQRKLAFGRCA